MCPFALLIYIMITKSSIIMRMEMDGLYSGYRLNRWAPPVSHLMFADDVMLFGIMNERTIAAISRILHDYTA